MASLPVSAAPLPPASAPMPGLLIVDDHSLVRIGVRALVAAHFDDQFTVTEASTLEDGLMQLRHAQHRVALMLLDLQLPDAKGFAGLRIVLRDHPQVPVIVLSGAQDPRVREEALRLGAAAYISKAADMGGLDGLLEILRRHVPGAGTLPAATAPATAQSPPAHQALRAAEGLGLSPRQVQVLELVLRGLDNQAIGEETGLSLGTVKNYVSSVFLSFNVRSRAELMGLFPN